LDESPKKRNGSFWIEEKAHLKTLAYAYQIAPIGAQTCLLSQIPLGILKILKGLGGVYNIRAFNKKIKVPILV